MRTAVAAGAARAAARRRPSRADGPRGAQRARPRRAEGRDCAGRAGGGAVGARGAGDAAGEGRVGGGGADGGCVRRAGDGRCAREGPRVTPEGKEFNTDRMYARGGQACLVSEAGAAQTGIRGRTRAGGADGVAAESRRRARDACRRPVRPRRARAARGVAGRIRRRGDARRGGVRAGGRRGAGGAAGGRRAVAGDAGRKVRARLGGAVGRPELRRRRGIWDRDTQTTLPVQRSKEAGRRRATRARERVWGVRGWRRRVSRSR